MSAVAVKEHGLIFKGPLVQAILEGRKTQTRRILKPQPIYLPETNSWRYATKKTCVSWTKGSALLPQILSPYAVGQRIWVRETWTSADPNCDSTKNAQAPILYRADQRNDDSYWDWFPSIHMPRWASRIALEITSVRVERLQEISQGDALAEGIQYDTKNLENEESLYPRDVFKVLWEFINGIGSWDANPWVWVVEFRREESKNA